MDGARVSPEHPMMRELLLLVDSDDRLRSRLASALETFNLAVSLTASAEEALQILSIEFPYLVAEMALPGMSGLDLLRISRRLCPKTRVVMLASTPSVEWAVAAFRAGAADYLVKPFSLDDILHALWRPDSNLELWQGSANTGERHTKAEALAAYQRSLLLSVF